MPTERWRSHVLVAEVRWRRLALRCLVHVTPAAGRAMLDSRKQASSRIAHGTSTPRLQVESLRLHCTRVSQGVPESAKVVCPRRQACQCTGPTHFRARSPGKDQHSNLVPNFKVWLRCQIQETFDLNTDTGAQEHVGHECHHPRFARHEVSFSANGVDNAFVHEVPTLAAVQPARPGHTDPQRVPSRALHTILMENLGQLRTVKVSLLFGLLQQIRIRVCSWAYPSSATTLFALGSRGIGHNCINDAILDGLRHIAQAGLQIVTACSALHLDVNRRAQYGLNGDFDDFSGCRLHSFVSRADHSQSRAQVPALAADDCALRTYSTMESREFVAPLEQPSDMPCQRS